MTILFLLTSQWCQVRNCWWYVLRIVWKMEIKWLNRHKCGHAWQGCVVLRSFSLLLHTAKKWKRGNIRSYIWLYFMVPLTIIRSYIQLYKAIIQSYKWSYYRSYANYLLTTSSRDRRHGTNWWEWWTPVVLCAPSSGRANLSTYRLECIMRHSILSRLRSASRCITSLRRTSCTWSRSCTSGYSGGENWIKIGAGICCRAVSISVDSCFVCFQMI